MAQEEQARREPLVARMRAMPAREKHDAVVSALLTPTMREELKEYAAAHGLTASTLIRMMITSTLEQAKAKEAGQ